MEKIAVLENRNNSPKFLIAYEQVKEHRMIVNDCL